MAQAEFIGWPALQQSFQRDLDALLLKAPEPPAMPGLRRTRRDILRKQPLSIPAAKR